MNRALRTLAAAAAALTLTVAVSACGGDDDGTEAASTGAGAATRTIEHFFGTTAVPAGPRRIVALQDQNALLPLLELGVTPVASIGASDANGATFFRRTEGFDTSGIAHIGDCCDANIEAVAAAEPDLIVGDEYSFGEAYEQFAQIAPSVGVQVFGRPLTDALVEFGRLVGREDRALELKAAYDARIDSLRERLGPDLTRTSVSLIAPGDPGSFGQADSGGQAQYTVMRDLGLPRPAPQRPGAEEDFATFSEERLPEHDADVLIVVDFSGEREAPGLASLRRTELYRNLAATRAGQSYTIDGTRTVGSAWARMDAFLDELETILLDPALDRDVVREDA